MTPPAPPTGIKRHFEGWQAGLVALVIAGVGIALGAPRGVPPFEVPVPVPDGKSLAETARKDTALAVELTGLTEAERVAAFDVRALGELIRKFGRADADGEKEKVHLLRGELVATASLIRRERGDAPLLSLRAYQLGVFLRELERWEATGVASDDLRLAGGDFVGLATANDWVKPPRQLVMDRVVRTALYKRRFAEITALRDAAFAPTLDESRALYAFLLTHPPPAGGVALPPGEASGPNGRRAAWQWIYRKVEELAIIDKDYPVDLARGVAQYQVGDARAAVISFREHLSKYPDGPYTLRARNYLSAALELAAP